MAFPPLQYPLEESVLFGGGEVISSVDATSPEEALKSGLDLLSADGVRSVDVDHVDLRSRLEEGSLLELVHDGHNVRDVAILIFTEVVVEEEGTDGVLCGEGLEPLETGLLGTQDVRENRLLEVSEVIDENDVEVSHGSMVHCRLEKFNRLCAAVRVTHCFGMML